MPLSNSDDLVGLLAHRPQFRFVDSVVAFVPGVSITAQYLVTGQEECLTGHFPKNPIFPGVLQVEALAQAGGIAVLSDERYAGRFPLFGGAEKIRWRRIVRPGDELTLEVTLEQLSAKGGWGQGSARVGDELACKARIFFVLAPNEIS